MKEAVDRLIEEAREIRRREASRIVVPGGPLPGRRSARRRHAAAAGSSAAEAAEARRSCASSPSQQRRRGLRAAGCDPTRARGAGARARRRRRHAPRLPARGSPSGSRERGVATLRYQFPYMEQGTRRPDPPALLLATRARGRRLRGGARADGLPLFAGGKSLGGRMTSTAAARAPLPGVRGLVFLGFPLHAAGRPRRERARAPARGEACRCSSSRARATRSPTSRSCARCARRSARARALHVVEGGDHSFHVLKRSGRSDEAVLDELADSIAAWMDGV